MEKPNKQQVLLLDSITSTGTKKKLQRRTTTGKLQAVYSTKFIASGKIMDGSSGEVIEKVENQTFSDLVKRGVDLIKIPGLKKNMAVALT